MSTATPVRRVWKTAQLLVGFHVDQNGKRREQPKVWSPKDGTASIHADPNLQETFVQLGAQSHGDEPGRDVQVKFRADKIVVTRPDGIGWEGLVIAENIVTVRVNGMFIRILADGSVSQNPEIGSTLISSDGAVLKHTGDVHVFVAPDGLEMRCRTPLKETMLTQAGVFERDLGILATTDDSTTDREEDP